MDSEWGEMNLHSKQSPVGNIRDETDREVSLMLNNTDDSSPSHHRSPESVLFEWEADEVSCCKQLSPKIAPRMTKTRLNLDIPEPGSDENDSDRSNSITEGTRERREYPEKEISDESVEDNVLEKTISVDGVFDVTLKKRKEPRKSNLIHSRTISSHEFTDSSVTSTRYNVATEDTTRDDIVRDKETLSVIEATSSVELPEIFSNCSKGVSQKLSTHSCVSDNLEEPITCDSFDVPASTGPPETQYRACTSDFDDRADIESLGLNDFHWFGPTDNFPAVRQREIEKIHSQPELEGASKIIVNSKKRTSFENPHERSDNESEDYFFTRTGSPPAKRCRTAPKYDDIKQPGLFLPPVEVHESLTAPPIIRNDENSSDSLKNNQNGWPKALLSVNCKTIKTESYVTIDPDSKSESCLYVKTVKTKNPLTLRAGDFTISTRRISASCQWLVKKIIIILKKSYGTIRQIFKSAPSSLHHNDDELTRVMSLIRSENEKILSVLTEKVNLLSNEFAQVRVSNETTLEALRTEVSELKGLSDKLANNNEILTRELRTFAEIRENSKPILSTISAPMFAAPPPPPPPLPPPPPPPPPFLQSITPATPNSSGKRTIRTPTRKCSTPLLGSRPAITVEDLLKVTLKKAPRNNKENRRNTVLTPRGPVVSLDMLRSVKLKSARRKASEYGERSPRRTQSLKSRPTSSMSLSPTMAGAESPLGRILRQQADVNPRRASKRRLTSSTNSENDLTRERSRKFDEARHGMSCSGIA